MKKFYCYFCNQVYAKSNRHPYKEACKKHPFPVRHEYLYFTTVSNNPTGNTATIVETELKLDNVYFTINDLHPQVFFCKLYTIKNKLIISLHVASQDPKIIHADKPFPNFSPETALPMIQRLMKLRAFL